MGRPEIKIKTDYLDSALDPKYRSKTIKKAVGILRPFIFDTVVFTGVSGALIGPSVADRLKKSLIVVRKSRGGSHSPYTVEGDTTARTYIVVDDFISTGDTFRKVVKAMEKFIPTAKCVGFYHYDRGKFSFYKNSMPHIALNGGKMRKVNAYNNGRPRSSKYISHKIIWDNGSQNIEMRRRTKKSVARKRKSS